MEWPGNLFWEEEQKLAKEFYSQFSEEEMEHVMTEEEEKEADRQFDQWMNEHASENLKLWRDYRRWIGDEGQLCDGNWHSLRHGDDDFGWIQEWDINEDGYCLYKGTNELILNMQQLLTDIQNNNIRANKDKMIVSLITPQEFESILENIELL